MPLIRSLQDMPMIVFMQTGWLCPHPQKLWTSSIAKDNLTGRCIYFCKSVHKNSLMLKSPFYFCCTGFKKRLFSGLTCFIQLLAVFRTTAWLLSSTSVSLKCLRHFYSRPLTLRFWFRSRTQRGHFGRHVFIWEDTNGNPELVLEI